MSLMGRAHNKTLANEAKRASTGSESLRQGGAGGIGGNGAVEDEAQDGPGPRTLYFNLPLPKDQQNEHGLSKNSYSRNKIRTAKYTPLSFIPKNLYFQFHNIANIFFLFQVILAVSIWPCFYALFLSSSPLHLHCLHCFYRPLPALLTGCGSSLLFSAF